MTQDKHSAEEPPWFPADVARQAKAMAVLAFRNGPIEDVHAGKSCPTCVGDPNYSGITQDEMKRTMKFAVNTLATFINARDTDPEAYEEFLAMGDLYTTQWDPPTPNR